MEWKRDPDELKSAQMLLDEFTAPESGSTSGGKEPLYTIEQITLTPQPGLTAIAFALPKLLREVGGRVRELSLDSACTTFIIIFAICSLKSSLGNTNGSRYELYALLGEVYVSGMPLGYLLVQSTPESVPGGKEKFLRQLLAHFRKVWKVRALITLTDTDWAKINAFLAEYTDAKHQLCCCEQSRLGLQFFGGCRLIMQSSLRTPSSIGSIPLLFSLHNLKSSNQ